MEAASNPKKRKIRHEEEEEEEEEAKIEKFCALIKSIRESRERLLKFGSSGGDGERENTLGIKEEKRVGVWKPEFEVEDFTEEEIIRHKYPPLGAGQESNKKAEKGVDLNLSLSL